MTADVQDARGPEQRRENDRAVAQHGGAAGPVEGGRVEEDDEAGQAYDHAGDPPRGEPLVQEQLYVGAKDESTIVLLSVAPVSVGENGRDRVL